MEKNMEKKELKKKRTFTKKTFTLGMIGTIYDWYIPEPIKNRREG